MLYTSLFPICANTGSVFLGLQHLNVYSNTPKADDSSEFILKRILKLYTENDDPYEEQKTCLR